MTQPKVKRTTQHTIEGKLTLDELKDAIPKKVWDHVPGGQWGGDVRFTVDTGYGSGNMVLAHDDVTYCITWTTTEEQ